MSTTVQVTPPGIVGSNVTMFNARSMSVSQNTVGVSYNTVVTPVSTQTVKVNNFGGVLGSSAQGVTLKNQIKDINSITDIPGVVITDLEDGASLVYNATTGKYDVRPINGSDLVLNVDGGTF